MLRQSGRQKYNHLVKWLKKNGAIDVYYFQPDFDEQDAESGLTIAVGMMGRW